MDGISVCMEAVHPAITGEETLSQQIEDVSLGTHAINPIPPSRTQFEWEALITLGKIDAYELLAHRWETLNNETLKSTNQLARQECERLDALYRSKVGISLHVRHQLKSVLQTVLQAAASAPGTLVRISRVNKHLN